MNTMSISGHGSVPLPTLGWLENGRFHAMDNVFLQSLMDCPVRAVGHGTTSTA